MNTKSWTPECKKKFLKPPSKDKYINFNSELGSNGQFDEIALILFEEDNPGVDCLECQRWYYNKLQENFEKYHS